jgi:hypothetical protein
MKTKHLLLSCFILTLCTLTAYGQQQRGDLELQFIGSYYRTVGTSGSTFGSANISAKIGPYVTDNIQIGIGPSLTVSHSSYTYQSFSPAGRMVEKEVSETKTTFGTYGFIVYSFLSRNGKLVPYVGVQYFKQDFNKPWSEEAGSLGLNGGFKYFFAKKAAFDLQGNYLFDLNPDSEGGYLLFAFGLSFLI